MAERQGSVFWSRGDETEQVSFVPGVDISNNLRKFVAEQHTKRSSKSDESKQVVNSGSKKKDQTDKASKSEKQKSAKSNSHVQLKDLCLEDKQRVANLVRELAKVGEEKEATEFELGNAKRKFGAQVKELKAEKQKVEEEQQALITQYRDCQKLLAYYQNKLSEQQKEVSNDINRLLTEAPALNVSRSSSGKKKPSSGSKNRKLFSGSKRKQRDDVIGVVEDVVGMENVPSERFTDAQGSLGESYMQSKDDMAAFSTDDLTTNLNNGRITSQQRSLPDKPVRDRHRDSDDSSDARFIAELRASVHRQARISEMTGSQIASLRSTSPFGRRDELMRQKKALEDEQTHLQRLLEEQEELLRVRHEELEKRHEQYMDRMRHMRRHHSCVPEPQTKLVHPRNQHLSRGHVTVDSLPVDTDGHHVTRSEPITESHLSLGRGYLHHSSSALDPEFISGCYVTDDHSRDVRSLSEPRNRSKPWSPSSMSFSKATPLTTMQMYDVTSSTRRKFHRPTSHSADLRATSRSRDETTDLLISSTRPTDFTSHMSDFPVTSPSRHDDVADVLTSGTESRAFATMNNISTLSDLVDTVDHSDDVSALSRADTTSARSSRGTDVIGSSTFDPEDSALLEEIFFIK